MASIDVVSALIVSVFFGSVAGFLVWGFLEAVLAEWDLRHEKAAENVKNVPPTKSDKGPLL